MDLCPLVRCVGGRIWPIPGASGRNALDDQNWSMKLFADSGLPKHLTFPGSSPNAPPITRKNRVKVCSAPFYFVPFGPTWYAGLAEKAHEPSRYAECNLRESPPRSVEPEKAAKRYHSCYRQTCGEEIASQEHFISLVQPNGTAGTLPERFRIAGSCAHVMYHDSVWRKAKANPPPCRPQAPINFLAI